MQTARFIAQWAINAVDFRDRDSIMTPFDYDPTFAVPTATLTGWNAARRHRAIASGAASGRNC